MSPAARVSGAARSAQARGRRTGSEAGLLERSTDANDSRATVVTVTDAGLAALDDWMRVLGEALAPRFADLDNDEWAAIRRAADIVESRTRLDAPALAVTR